MKDIPLERSIHCESGSEHPGSVAHEMPILCRPTSWQPCLEVPRTKSLCSWAKEKLRSLFFHETVALHLPFVRSVRVEHD